MRERELPWQAIAVAVAAGLLALPEPAAAQAVVGNAKAVRATTFDVFGGTTTVLADTGSLAATDDARGAGQATGSVPALVTGEALSAATMGWPDQVASEASLASLGITVAGVPISADFVMAGATALFGGGTNTSFLVENLTIAGVPVAVTGEPNQTITIPGGQVVLNEQSPSSNGSTTVNALHVVVSGVADVVVASATAGIQ